MKRKISLLILTTASMIAMIWAGFTRNEALFPILLSTTTAFSMANLALDTRKGKGKTLYKVAMSFAIFSIIICGATLLF
ncbi:hypothetical protein [Alkalihalobacillus sp. R86527]|uniref:hypothetical protein n=1 Tax=Alkalihalobacillus sp. R86527 TaxID=3093863 RepID=UPI00366DB79E